MAAGSYGQEPREQKAFQRLLHWLDEGVDSGGQKYLEIYRRLVSYFDRRNCAAPLELADETLSRVARRLDEEGALTGSSPARYCYIVARFVFLEYQRQARPFDINVSELPMQVEGEEAGEDQERRLACLERCLQQLDSDQRSMILEYYRGEGSAKIDGRRALAARLHLSMNALSIRACRIRDRLQSCVRSCEGAQPVDVFSRFRLK